MRSILLHAHDDAGFEGRLQVSLDLARTFDAHLTCLQAISVDIAFAGDFYGTFGAEMVPLATERAKAFREKFEARLAGEDVRWEWVDRMGLGDTALLQYAGLSDLVVLGASSPDGTKTPSWLAGTLAIHARVPILAVPEHCRAFAGGAPALVAWNGSVESSRALRAAVPLLARASSVTLATVGSGEGDEDVDLPAVQGCEYLARHGIGSELIELPADGEKTVARKLADAAQAREAGFIVMGAYGQPRMFELLLGGVTRGLLADTPVPLLMAH